MVREKIKIIIADDNKVFCMFLKQFLENFEEIDILGIANTDEEEINLIENLKPDIVITDLMRNRKYTGLEIIKEYYKKNILIQFLVISADREEDVITDGLKVAGYIKKPIIDYKVIFEELKKIKGRMNQYES